jgi:hypothetical protein
MDRIDPKYYFKKRIERRKRQVFEAFVFIMLVTMFTLLILIYIKHGC